MTDDDLPRVARIRRQLDWPQHRLAEWLGVTQPTVARLEKGQPEPGPIARLLDRLEREIADKTISAEASP